MYQTEISVYNVNTVNNISTEGDPRNHCTWQSYEYNQTYFTKHGYNDQEQFQDFRYLNNTLTQQKLLHFTFLLAVNWWTIDQTV